MLPFLFAPRPLSPFVLEIDGQPVQFRSTRPDDAAAFVASYELLSERSRRLRFFGQISSLSSKQIDFLTHPDGVYHVAWGAFLPTQSGEPLPEQLLGVGRFIRRGNTSPEVALTLIDAWQHKGLGLVLHAVLHRQAASLGIRQLIYDVSEENEAFLRHLKALGGKVVNKSEHVVRLVMPVYGRRWRIPKTPAGQRLKVILQQLAALPTTPAARMAPLPKR
jgi:hypothetical protein